MTKFWEEQERKGASVEQEKPFGIDMASLGPVDQAAARHKQTLIEKARLNAERKEYEKLMVYARDPVLMAWFQRLREDAVKNLIKAPSADGRVYWQAAVRTVEGIVEQVAGAEEQFHKISDMLDKL